MHSLLPFFGLFILISLSGLLLYVRRGTMKHPLLFLVALGAGTMLAVSLGHIFPESLETAWEPAIYAFIWGFLALYLIEEFLSPHAHDHSHGNHSHEDPHEHIDHVTLVSWGGIFLHTLLDGLAIASGFHLDTEVGIAVLFAIMIHQAPVSLSLAGILRQSHLRINIQVGLIVLFALAAPIGFFISDSILWTVSDITIALAGAFSWGSLLYIATTDLMPIVHNVGRNKYSMILCFCLGVIGTLIWHEFIWHTGHETWITEHEHKE